MELLGPFPAWGESVHRARWTARGRPPVAALAVLGPEHDDPRALERARKRAEPWIDRAPAGVLPLLGVAEVGPRTAWVYRPTEAVSVGLVVEDSGLLPLRAAAELVGRVAEIIEGAGPEALHHPGPRLDEVLVDETGRVLLAGFVGPFPRGPAWREPTGADDSAAMVWRLGVLLGQLLTGAPPQAATDPARHDAAVRRTLIRVLARPGPVFPDRLRDQLVSMLAWDPLARPALVRVADALRRACDTLPEPSLVAWAIGAMPPVQRRASAGDPIRTPEPPLDTGSFELPPRSRGDRTEEISILQMTTLPGDGPAPLPEKDDETAISTTGVQPRAHVPEEYGSIPVKVGPPPEALLRPAPLPTDLFDESTEGTPTEPDPEAPLPMAALATATAALAVIGTLLAWYLFS